MTIAGTDPHDIEDRTIHREIGPATEISKRPNPVRRLMNVWAYRELLGNLVRKELKVKYKNRYGRTREYSTAYEGVIPWIKRRHEGADEDQVRRPAGDRTDPTERPHDRGGDQRRDQRISEGEREDVAARASARHEELRVAPQQVEQRLGEGERPEPAEVQRRPPEADRPRLAAHARGRAS